ncbi:MAG: pyridoxal phosphate-dependent aminotransferase [Acidobacteriota bacterium]
MKKPFPVSQNVAAMHASATLKAGQAAAELREKGYGVIDLSLGEPDFDTPEFIKQYAIEGMEHGLTKYTPTAGLKKFRDAIVSYYHDQFGADISPAEIVASGGGKQALFNAACTILDPGDELLIPKPYWVTFPEIGTFCRAKNVFIDTEETEFILTADQVKAAITDKTKLLIINSPNNPTGRVIPPDAMRRIVETCAERGVYVLTDECYLYFAYPPNKPFTSATLPRELQEFVCVAGSFSKTYAMTGWRIGFTVANEEWTRAILRLQGHSSTHPTSFVQYACARALEDQTTTVKAVTEMTSEYERRKNWLIPALNEVNRFKCAMPEGAFYAFVDVREMLGDSFHRSADVAECLLRDTYTVVTDGEPFGAEGFLRISYATSMENLHTAIERMKTLFNSGKPVAAGKMDP